MAQEPDIRLADAGPVTWVLADDGGPVNLTGADVTLRVIGPRPSGDVIVDELACAVIAPGRVAHPRAGLVAGWLGFVFTAEWAGESKQFPSTGPRWLLVE